MHYTNPIVKLSKLIAKLPFRTLLSMSPTSLLATQVALEEFMEDVAKAPIVQCMEYKEGILLG